MQRAVWMLSILMLSGTLTPPACAQAAPSQATSINEATSTNATAASQHAQQGAVLAAEHREEDALREYTAALEQDPTLPGAHLQRGKLELLLGRPQDALTDLEAERGATSADQAFALRFYRALALERSGAVAQARQAFLALERERPRDPAPNLQLGLLAVRLGAWTEAQARLEAACQADPQSVSAHAELARVYYRLQQRARAAQEQRQAVRLSQAEAAQAHQMGMGTMQAPATLPVP